MILRLQVWKRREPSGESSPPDSRSAWRRRVWKKLVNPSRQFSASANRTFEFHKRSQLFIRSHNETLSIVTVRVSNPRFHQRFAIIGVHSYCFACGARECSSKTMFPLRFIAITFSTILLYRDVRRKLLPEISILKAKMNHMKKPSHCRPQISWDTTQQTSGRV